MHGSAFLLLDQKHSKSFHFNLPATPIQPDPPLTTGFNRLPMTTVKFREIIWLLTMEAFPSQGLPYVLAFASL
jgi:hypothetical protein